MLHKEIMNKFVFDKLWPAYQLSTNQINCTILLLLHSFLCRLSRLEVKWGVLRPMAVRLRIYHVRRFSNSLTITIPFNAAHFRVGEVPDLSRALHTQSNPNETQFGDQSQNVPRPHLVINRRSLPTIEFRDEKQ